MAEITQQQAIANAVSAGAALQRRSAEIAVMPAEMSIEELVARTRKVQEAMKAVMHDGEHYGVIPGTGSKPTLLKPGAEKLLNLFMMDPQYDAPERYEGDHLTVTSRCTLYHIPTGARLGSGMGMCSTREAKYAYRQGKRVCPKCGAETINRSKYPPRSQPNALPGWYCFGKAGGCNAEFAIDDAAITGQNIGRIDNPDKPDQYNTVLKMANKRSLIAAVLNVTGASDIFTQDLEDLPETAGSVRAASPGGTTTMPATTQITVAMLETPDQEAARLFPDEPAEESAEVMLARALGLLDSRVKAEAVRKKLWDQSCAPTPYRAMPPREQLLALLGSLGAK